MPDLSEETIHDLTNRLERFLEAKIEYGTPEYITSGGSAAIFKVRRSNELRAIKVFDPKFIDEAEDSIERQRLKLQERLIGHQCQFLVQTYSIELAQETAFIEMEYIEWPSLKKIIKHVPDEAVAPLISQLVTAVRFLESLSIVHRDIKPENIHISEDWSSLKLLDLGVVREFDPAPDAAETDQGQKRPFLATAQYSSPEYLFRLDEPSSNLWKALNFYQIGAVLHDLIMKEPIFHAEMEAENRWLVARAVLNQTPSFIDIDSSRLTSLKSLALRCLTKDMNLRLQLVCWEDFNLEGDVDPLKSLRGQLRAGRTADASSQTEVRRLAFDRSEFVSRTVDRVRETLASVCGTDLPFTFQQSNFQESPGFTFIFSFPSGWRTCMRVHFEWQDGFYLRFATTHLTAALFTSNDEINLLNFTPKAVNSVEIGGAENELVLQISNQMASAAKRSIDIINCETEKKESNPPLNGTDLLS